MTHIIRCRANITNACLHGQPTTRQFGEDLPMDEDGTYRQGTIICDVCYMALMPHTPSGRGLHHELDAAIAKLQR